MKNITAHISLLVCNLIWGCAYPLYKSVLGVDIDPLPLFTLTITFTALLSLVTIPMSGWQAHRVEGSDVGAVIGAGLLIALLRKGMLMFGLSMTSPIDGSIISTMSPVVVLVVAALVGLERFSVRKVLGVLCGFGGAVGVILTGSSGSGSENGVVGNLMILMCAFISATYIVWFKSLLQRYEPMVVLRWMFCVAAVVTIPFGIHSVLKVDTSTWDLRVWGAVAYLVMVPTYLPNLLLTSALKRVSPTVTSIYIYVQPAVAVSISVWWGLAPLRLSTVIFAMLIFTGVGIVIMQKKS